MNWQDADPSATVFSAPRSNVNRPTVPIWSCSLKALGFWAKTEDLIYPYIFNSITAKSIVQQIGNYTKRDKYVYASAAITGENDLL